MCRAGTMSLLMHCRGNMNDGKSKSRDHVGLGRIIEPIECFNWDGKAYLVMPKADGDLMQLRATHKRWTFAQIQKMARGMFMAALCVSDAGYAHCDIKPENFLYRKNDDPQVGWDVTLADFGAAAKHGEIARSHTSHRNFTLIK